MLEKHPDLYSLAEPLQQKNCSSKILCDSGIRLLLAVYNAPQSEHNIDKCRYTQFIKSTMFNRPMQLSSLSPTSSAALQHIYRVYHQVQTWLGGTLEPKE